MSLTRDLAEFAAETARIADRTVAHLVIPGRPQPKERHRTGRGRTYTPAATTAAEAAIGFAFRAAARGHVPDAGPYGVLLLAVMPNRVRADIDNVLKLGLDGLNGAAWIDDRYVTAVRAWRPVGSPSTARTEIVVYRRTEETR